jgi:hypothetical protein
MTSMTFVRLLNCSKKSLGAPSEAVTQRVVLGAFGGSWVTHCEAMASPMKARVARAAVAGSGKIRVLHLNHGQRLR